MGKYHLTQKALDDLDSIWNYTKQTWSENQADQYYYDIITAINNIAKGPRLIDREYSELMYGLYCRHCNKHLIFYRKQNILT